MNLVVPPYRKNFASDNNSGVHPEILKSIESVNVGHAHAYGGDSVTEQGQDIFKKHFGKNIDVHFVFNGTASNVTSLKSLLKTYESVICAETAHLNMDECGAPEAIGGFKLITIATPDGKLRIEDIEKKYIRLGDQHYSQPRAISITQPTELGTVYSIDEIKAITKWAHARNMFVHVDGARFANAVYTLKTDFKTLSADAGVDVLSLGGTKNGLLFGEAVIFFNPELSKEFKYVRKQAMQLPSKMRYLAAQFYAYFSTDLWHRIAKNSCDRAQELATKLKELPEVKITQAVQSNAVFAEFPRAWVKPLKDKYFFYIWNEETFEARWMCSFDTLSEDVEAFVAEMKRLRN